jgi:hypothetical protein
MKTIFCAACLLLALSGYPQLQNIALKLVGAARQQLPRPIAEFLPNNHSSAYQLVTAPGLEKQLSARLSETLQGLIDSESLNQARVSLKQVRFVPTSAVPGVKTTEHNPVKARHSEEDEDAPPTTGIYVATINYDLLSPLTVESGATLLTAACSCGVARVRLSDGYGVVKTFNCPVLRN